MHPPPAPARSVARPSSAALVLILAVAAILRFWALGQGIPFALGVDEPEVMERAVRMMKTGDFNPHFFDYPALYIYFQAIVAVLRFIWGAMHAEWSSLTQAPASAFYLWGRALTASLGTLTVLVVYRTGLRWGSVTAMVAAALFAVMPLHVRESHYVLTDVPMTLFVALTFLSTLRAAERPSRRAFVLAGVASGLAAAMKYNGALAVLMPVATCVTCGALHGRRIRTTAATIAAFVVTFFVCAPYTLLDLPAFLNGFGRLATLYRTIPLASEPAAVTYTKHLRIALGWTGSAIALAGLALAAWRTAVGPDRLRWAIALVFPALYFAFIADQRIVYARYLLPILPFLALLAAAGIETAIASLRRMRTAPRLPQAAAALLLLMATVPPAWTSVGFDADAGKVWTTELAYGWIRGNLPPGSSLLVESRALVFGDGYDVRNIPTLRLAPADARPQYLVASSQIYGPYMDHPTQYPGEYADYMRIFRQSPEVARFVPSREHPGPEIRILKVVP